MKELATITELVHQAFSCRYILKVRQFRSLPRTFRMKVKKAFMAAGGKRIRKTPTELPEELIQNEILIRLPIKSVARFKSVCKSWLSLFSNPQFVKEKYALSATQNPNEYDCLVAEKENRIVILSRYKETMVLPTDRSYSYQLVGSIHGLVCLRHCQKLSLWNPAIHQSKEITLTPHLSREVNRIGLGFDPVSNDYKVVVSVDSRFASVYSFQSDSWTDLSVPAKLLPKSRLWEWTSFTPTTYVKDCPYWTTYVCTHIQSISFISVKFDGGSNELKLLPEFHYARGIVHLKHFKILNMNDRLSLLVHRPHSFNIMVELYSLDEKGCGAWTKMYNVGPIDFHNEGIMFMSHGFRYGGEIVFDVSGKLFCVDHKTDTIKRIKQSSDFNLVSSYGYTPSLVFLPGMKSVYSQTQTRTHGLCFKTPRRLIDSLRG